MRRPRGDVVCSLPAQQRLDQSRTVGAGAGSPRTAAVPGLGAGRTGSAAQPGLREQPGVPQCFGKWGEACKGCRRSRWRPQGWDRARGFQLGRSAEPGLSTTFQDRHWQTEAQAWPEGAPSKQQLYSQHRSLAQLHGSPSPKTQPGDSPQSLNRLPVPHVNRFAVSRGTWVFFSPFWRR